jgi:hypothetical protein
VHHHRTTKAPEEFVSLSNEEDKTYYTEPSTGPFCDQETSKHICDQETSTHSDQRENCPSHNIGHDRKAITPKLKCYSLLEVQESLYASFNGSSLKIK